jgi:hypothetical protein
MTPYQQGSLIRKAQDLHNEIREIHNEGGWDLDLDDAARAALACVAYLRSVTITDEDSE